MKIDHRHFVVAPRPAKRPSLWQRWADLFAEARAAGIDPARDFLLGMFALSVVAVNVLALCVMWEG